MMYYMERGKLDKEMVILAKARNAYPKLFIEPTFIDDDIFLSHFGINIPRPKNCPLSYLKLFPHDFIVEEIDSEGLLHTIEYEKNHPPLTTEKRSWSATMVKCGITTPEALKIITNQLGIPESSVTYAGIKDKQAITAQRISIKNVSYQEIIRIQSPSLFLKNIKPYTDVLSQGSLRENRFTIRLRFADEINEMVKSEIEPSLVQLKERGYYNFFYLQRFGVPRFLAHKWGKFIVDNNMLDLIESVLFEPSANELTFWSELRSHAASAHNDLNKVSEFYAPFPFYLGQENALLNSLRKHPPTDPNLLLDLKSYAQIWVSAYNSLLWNQELSKRIIENNIPHELPLLRRQLNHLPFLSTRESMVRTILPVKNLSITWNIKSALLEFTLSKGSYATCFLSHLINIVSGTAPTNISRDMFENEAKNEHKETFHLFETQIRDSQIRVEK